MNPRLIAVGGPLKGSVFPLPEGASSVGRSANHQVLLRDSAVSRDHCVFERAGAQVTVVDSGSHNGTLVNGSPITRRELLAGDEIRVGASAFLFMNEGTDARVQEGEPKTIARRPEDSIFLSQAGDVPSDPTGSRTARDMRLLLRLSTLLHSFRALYDAQAGAARDALSKHLMALLMEIVPARSGGVYGPSPSANAPYTVLAQSAEAPALDGEAFQQVVNDKLAILTSVAGDDPDTIAAPLLVRDEVEAILYLTAREGQVFDEGHLELLSAISSMAAVAWENASLLDWLRQENEDLRQELRADHGMIGDSARMREMQSQIARVAPSHSTVLIIGESGTGKELIARAIHRNSGRAAGPFIAINCAALTDTLLESELFGYEKGSFTGAISQRKGKLEVANGGTVFLDEIGELSPLLQAKFLRVLQERELQRVGGTQTIKLDIRLIAATNRDLADMAKRGEFRQDLFYRLNVVNLKPASLRQRPEDILPLADHFARKFSVQCGRKLAGISPRAKAYLQGYSWPGNVRELENAIERAVVLGVSDFILPEDLPEAIREERPSSAQESPGATFYEEAVDVAKRQAVMRAFEQAGYEHDAASKLLGLHPNYLHRLIRNLDIKASLKSAARAR